MLRTPLSCQRLGALCALALALLVLVHPASALGHAAFLDSNPAPGTRLKTGPAQVRLDFTEPLNRNLSSATLIDSTTGHAVAARSSTSGDRTLLLEPQTRLAKGAYRVDWHTVSTLDGHALEGSSSFGVRVAPTFSEGRVEQSPLARGGWLRIALRAAMYGLLFFFAGGILNAAILSPRGRPGEWLIPLTVARRLEGDGYDAERARARAWQRTLTAGWLAVAAAVAVALAEASDASGGVSPAGLGDFLLANGAGLARVGTVAALLLAALSAMRYVWAAAAWVVIAFWLIALSGHANSADPRAVAITTDWLHLVAAAVWVGGIAQLAWTWLPDVRRLDPPARLTVIGSVLARFGRIAIPAFLVVVASGLTNALIQLGEPQALWQTSYGRVLAVKIGFVGSIALASYGHALRLRPLILAANPHPGSEFERRHWRLLALEPWLGLGVIVAVAALVAFPLPPRQLSETDEAAAAAPCEPSCPLPAARAEELPVATHAGPDLVALWLRRDGGGLTGTVRVLDTDLKPVDSSVQLDGEAMGCGTGCWRISAASSRRRFALSVSDQNGQTHRVSVPAAWSQDRSGRAHELLARAQRTMRGLGTARMNESVTSGLGQTVRTRYRFKSPDRMAYTTSGGTRLIAINRTSYESLQGGPWKKGPFGALTGVQFSQFFRWTIYGRSVRWLGANRRVVKLAFFDEATPVWYRLTVDRASDRVVREEMIAPGHFMERRWFAFDQPVRIAAPG